MITRMYEAVRTMYNLTLIFFSLFAAAAIALLLRPLAKLSECISRPFCQTRHESNAKGVTSTTAGCWLSQIDAMACNFLIAIATHFMGNVFDRNSKFTFYAKREDREAFDSIKERKPHAMMLASNHVSYVDCFQICGIMRRVSLKHAGYMKFFARKNISYIPGIGQAMLVGGHFFLDRKWEVDQKTIKNTIEFHKAKGQPYAAMIHPEGTFSTAEDCKIVQSCAKHCEAKGLQPLEYCLTTRRKGLQLVFESDPELKEYWDITLAYEGGKNLQGRTYGSVGPLARNQDRVVPDVVSYVCNRAPENVHVHLRRLEVPDLSQVDLGAWLHARQVEKDVILKHFHEKGCFPDQRFEREESTATIYLSNILTSLAYLLTAWSFNTFLGLWAVILLLAGTFGVVALAGVIIIMQTWYDSASGNIKESKREE